MKKASQIVFLVDVDCMMVCNVQGANAPGRRQRTMTKNDCPDNMLTSSKLHQICLRFLSYFAAQQCAVNGVSVDGSLSNCTSTLVKWGYKFYRSRSTRPVHQRYQFKDLDVQSLAQFAVDLEDQLRRNVVGELDQSALTLERAIRELICDFPWDSPYISSPVKLPRNTASMRCNGSSTVDNYVILITKVPSSSDELHRFTGASLSACWPTAKQILECVAPPTVRQLMCNVAKIRLLWMDAQPFYYNTPENIQDGQQMQHSFELVHEALTIIGGGIVPLGAVLLHDTLSDGFRKTGATCHRFHFPESYRVRVPFAAVLSVYSNYGEIKDELRLDTILDVPSALENNDHSKHPLQLLSLFKKITCPHERVESVICDCACTSHPQILRAIGTMKLGDMRTNLAAETKVYICCPNKVESGLRFQDLLDDLTTEYKAMVVSSETSALGILVPANDDSCIAVLYMLLGKTQFPLDFSNGEDDGIADLVSKFMIPWKVEASSGAGSAEFLNRWLHGENDSQCKMKKGEEELIGKLQRSHRSSVKTVHQEGHQRRSPRLSKSHCQNTLQRSSKISPKSLMFDQNVVELKSKCKTNGLPGDSENEFEDCGLLIKDLPNEAALLSDVKKSYAASLSDDNLIDTARKIIRTVKGYYCKVSKADHVKKSCRKFLIQNVFQSAKDLALKYSKSPDLPKNDRIQETHLQVVMCLEIQRVLSKEGGVDLADEITLLLRSLSFIAGPSELSEFLHDMLIKNYYHCLRNTVGEICEELNQPLPDDVSDTEHDSLSPALSLSSVIGSGDGIGEPKQLEMTDVTAASSSLISQLSVTSSLSSIGSQYLQPKNKRSSIVRHPSFFEVSHKRQIVVSSIKTAQTSATVKRSLKDRPKSISSLDEQKQRQRYVGRNLSHERQNMNYHRKSRTVTGFMPTNKHLTPPRREKLTTPKGRHVLKTKKVAETPLNKQVTHVTLAKQRSKRKLIPDEEIDKTIVGFTIVAETPEKHLGEFAFRRSPRQHASSLERQASFYSSESHSRNLVKAESQINLEKVNEQLMGLNKDNDLELLLDESSYPHQTTSSQTTPHRSTDEENDVSSPIIFTTPKRKARVKRHLNLGDCALSDTITQSKNRKSFLHQSAGLQLFESSDSVVDKCSLSSKEDVNVFMPPDSITVSTEEEVVTSEPQNEVELEVKCSSPKEDRKCEDDVTCVISSPLRNGYDSPTENLVTDSMPFPQGPLSLNENWSRSSSPGIPLLISNSQERVNSYVAFGAMDYEGSIWSDDDETLQELEKELSDPLQSQTTNGSTNPSSYNTALEDTPGNSESDDTSITLKSCYSSLNGNCSEVLQDDVEPDLKRRRLEPNTDDMQQSLICSKIILTNNVSVNAGQCKQSTTTPDGVIHATKPPTLAPISSSKASDQ